MSQFEKRLMNFLTLVRYLTVSFTLNRVVSMLNLFFLSFSLVLHAQQAVQISSQQKINLKTLMDAGDVFLFVQQDCEACEEAMLKTMKCPTSLRQRISLVALESDEWALKKSVSSEVVKMMPKSFFQMSREEAKKLDVIGTPTFRAKNWNKMASLNCDELKAVIHRNQ